MSWREVRTGSDWAVVTLGSLAAAVLLILGELSATRGGILAAGLAVLVWMARQDWWGRAYAITLALLIGASSSIASVAEASFYSRYVAAATLGVITFASGEPSRLSERPRVVRAFLWLLWALVALAAASTVWSFSPGVTALQAVALGLLAANVHGLLTRRWAVGTHMTQDLTVAYVVLVSAAAVSLAAPRVGLAGALSYSGRLQGIFSNPNTLGMAMALAIPLAWGVFSATGKWRYLATVSLPALAVIQSGSRTAFVAAVLGVVAIGIRYLFTRRYGTLAALAALGIGTLVYATGAWRVAEAVLSRFGSEEGGSYLNSREVAWDRALNLWQSRPIGGWGFSTGEEVFAAHHGTAGFGFAGTAAHGSVPQMLLELGIIGTALFGALVVILLISAMRCPLTGITSGAIGLVIAGVAIQVTESSAFGTGQVYPFVFWIAGAALVLGFSGAERPQVLHGSASPTTEPVAAGRDVGAT